MITVTKEIKSPEEELEARKHIEKLQTLAILQWVLTFILMGPLCLALTIYLMFTSYWWISSLYLLYFLIDKNTPERGGRRVNFIRKLPLWKYMADYFPTKLIKTCELDPNYNYIMGFHPHGVLSAGSFLNFATEGTGFEKVFPGISSHLSVLKGHFSFPIYRDWFMCSGAIAVTKRSLEYVLSGIKGRGNLVCLVVGGAKEALDGHPGKYRVHLTNRLGFIKVALRTGARLLPCISFNETRLYNQVPNAPGSIVRKIQECLTRVFGFSPPLFYAHGLIPFRTPITTVVGEPIILEQKRNPTKEDVQAAQKLYIDALSLLFDTHKMKYDPDGENLEIV